VKKEGQVGYVILNDGKQNNNKKTCDVKNDRPTAMGLACSSGSGCSCKNKQTHLRQRQNEGKNML